jgi:hypothetical protein
VKLILGVLWAMALLWLATPWQHTANVKLRLETDECNRLAVLGCELAGVQVGTPRDGWYKIIRDDQTLMIPARKTTLLSHNALYVRGEWQYFAIGIGGIGLWLVVLFVWSKKSDLPKLKGSG